jgi:hypothetical protein
VFFGDHVKQVVRELEISLAPKLSSTEVLPSKGTVKSSATYFLD